MRRHFVTLDVFTPVAFAGNPLAVVLDGEDLSDAAMQTVAREFNLSETVFVTPPRLAGNRAALRIFTPSAELPFAGHPTIGAAIALAERDNRAGPFEAAFVLEEKVGPVACRVERRDGKAVEASFVAPRLPMRQGVAESHEAIAAALGLTTYDIGFGNHVPTRYSAGVPFTFVPVRDLEAIRRIRIDLARWDAAFNFGPGAPAAFAYTTETVSEDAAVHGRMFAPSLGIPEDPATGSAVVALAGVLAEFDPLGEGTHGFLVEQGFEMGRPSHVRLDVDIRRGVPVEVRLGGAAVRVSEGMIEA